MRKIISKKRKLDSICKDQMIMSILIFMNFLISPWAYMRFTPMYYKIFQIISFGMLGLTIVIWLLAKLIRKEDIYLHSKFGSMLLLGMIGFNILASIFNIDTKASFITSIIMSVTVLYFFIIYDVFKRIPINAILKNLALIMNSTMIVFVIYQLICVVFGSVNIFGSLETGFYVEKGRYLMRALFENPNTLGLLGTVVIIFNMLAFQVEKNIVQRIFYLGMSAISVIVIVLTESRGGLLSAGIVILFYLILFRNELIESVLGKKIKLTKKGKLVLKIVGVALVLVLIASLFIVDYSEIGIIKKFEGGLRGRSERWDLAFDVVNNNLKSMIFGVGNLDDIPGRADFAYLYNTHNGFVNLIVRGGYTLFVAFIVYVGYAYIKSLKGYKVLTRANKNIVKCSLIAILALMVQQIFEIGIVFSSITHFAAMAFWIIIAILYKCNDATVKRAE